VLTKIAIVGFAIAIVGLVISLIVRL